MSSSSVCQGLQSCLIEPRVLRLKLAPPPPTTTTTTTTDKTNVNNHGGLSFLNCLSQSQHTKTNNNNTSYVHPVPTKRRLSDRSLQMCTESLGSETGSETTNDVFIITSSSPEKTPQRKQMNRTRSYPPPLTSTVQVRPRREGGRLLLEAVTVNTSHTYFHAERSHGRLRLSIIKDSFQDDDEDVVEEEEEEEDIEGINENDSGFMKKVSMPSRCKEGANNNQIVKWASPWVLTSS